MVLALETGAMKAGMCNAQVTNFTKIYNIYSQMINMLLGKQQWWHDQKSCQNTKTRTLKKMEKTDMTNIPQLKQATIPLGRLNGQENKRQYICFKLCRMCYSQYVCTSQVWQHIYFALSTLQHSCSAYPLLMNSIFKFILT